MPKKKKVELTTDEKLNQVLEAFEKEKEARIKAEAKLEQKVEQVKKEKDPMSGPGKICEVIKITKSESWQVPNKEVVNRETQTVETKPDMTKVPKGYTIRQGEAYIVKAGHEARADYPNDLDVIIPNCHSKYTRELTVFTKKGMQQRGNLEIEPPRVTVHLCEKHEKMFGAKTKAQVAKAKVNA